MCVIMGVPNLTRKHDPIVDGIIEKNALVWFKCFQSESVTT